MLKRLSDEVPMEEALQLNQTTFGSFARPSRGYFKRRGNSFMRTQEAQAVLKAFGHDEIFRQTPGELSIYFRETLAVVKKKSA